MKFFSYLEENATAYEWVQKLVTLNYRVFLRELKREVFFDRGKSYLDVGCGTVFFRDHLKDKDYVGVDLNPRYIAAAGLKRGDCFQTGNALNLTFLRKNFDRIISIGLVHHLDDAQVSKTLDQFCLHLKPDGEIFIIDTLWPSGKNLVGQTLRRFDNGAFVRGFSGWEKLFCGTLAVNALRPIRQWPFDYIFLRAACKVGARTT